MPDTLPSLPREFNVFESSNILDNYPFDRVDGDFLPTFTTDIVGLFLEVKPREHGQIISFCLVVTGGETRMVSPGESNDEFSSFLLSSVDSDAIMMI